MLVGISGALWREDEECLLPPTGNLPPNFHFKEVIHREELQARGRKYRRKKEILGIEKIENSENGTKQQTHRHYSETATHNGLLLLRHFVAQNK